MGISFFKITLKIYILEVQNILKNILQNSSIKSNIIVALFPPVIFAKKTFKGVPPTSLHCRRYIEGTAIILLPLLPVRCKGLCCCFRSPGLSPHRVSPL